jgi:cell division septum initiation protein DivIVA
MSRRAERLLRVAVVAACAVALPTTAASARGPDSPRPNLKPLWSAFPVRQHPRAAAPARPAIRTAVRARRPVPRAVVGDAGQGKRNVLLVAVAGVVGALLALLLLASTRLQGRAVLARPRAPRFPLTSKGGSDMANLRRRLRAKGEHGAPGGRSDRAGGRVADGLPAETVAHGGSVDERAQTTPQRVVGEQAEPEKAEAVTDLAAVGQEVGSVLKSAEEAAARIRAAASEEAERLRKEARAAATAYMGQARRAAEADRAEAERLRKEAEAYAEKARAAADSDAEKRRAKAEQEAAHTEGEMRKRLEGADAVLERKVHEAQVRARERVELLKAEAERYEERLDNMLVVFRGMSSQLEELLGPRSGGSDEPSEPPDGLAEALRPDAAGQRSG